jgi:hypothetical protein
VSERVISGPQFFAHSQPESIDAAIDSYPKHIRSESMGEEQAPYNASSLAEIYEPRVRQLMDLQSQGFTHARWGHDPESKTNKWFGHTPESAEVSRQP